MNTPFDDYERLCTQPIDSIDDEVDAAVEDGIASWEMSRLDDDDDDLESGLFSTRSI